MPASPTLLPPRRRHLEPIHSPIVYVWRRCTPIEAAAKFRRCQAAHRGTIFSRADFRAVYAAASAADVMAREFDRRLDRLQKTYHLRRRSVERGDFRPLSVATSSVNRSAICSCKVSCGQSGRQSSLNLILSTARQSLNKQYDKNRTV